MDLTNVQDKLTTRRRGGYCFEHGAVFGTALAQSGFRAQDCLARVTLRRTRAEAPRTHHFMFVSSDRQRWLVDPEFGGLAPTVPVPFAEGAEPVGPSRHRLVREGDTLSLQAEADGQVQNLLASQLEEALPIDLGIGNHYTATHPESLVVRRPLLRMLTQTGSIAVSNREVR